MKTTVPRIVLAGTNSGCGKTTVTCAILQALVNRNLQAGALKCGPDYIDPMFHSQIIGAKSANLDLSFFSENTARYLLAENSRGCALSLIEGVMGYYDGISMDSQQASTCHVAQTTESPAVLVVNARGLARSVLAIIEGFLHLSPRSMIQGVILNQCTPMTYSMLEKVIREHFKGEIRPLGYLPAMPQCALESRHLGLITAQEVVDLKEKMQILARQAEKSLDLDGILELSRQAPDLQYTPVSLPHFQERVRIGVAKDRAFCFYYGDNLRALEEMGAELVYFSPLEDSILPDNLQGLYLGGGYPELYGKKLSENVSMRRSVRQALEGNLPCIAECGGFMYLTEAVETYPMVGFLPGTCFDTGKLTRFGYVTLQAGKDNMLCTAGESIAAHEFHHWDCTENGEDFTARKRSGKTWSCVHATNTLYAGFPHFHFYAQPSFVQGFYEACRKELHHD